MKNLYLCNPEQIGPLKRLIHLVNAQVAKLVDALCSGRSVRKDVLVRIQSWALKRRVCRRIKLWHMKAEIQRCGSAFFMHKSGEIGRPCVQVA